MLSLPFTLDSEELENRPARKVPVHKRLNLASEELNYSSHNERRAEHYGKHNGVLECGSEIKGILQHYNRNRYDYGQKSRDRQDDGKPPSRVGNAKENQIQKSDCGDRPQRNRIAAVKGDA